MAISAVMVANLYTGFNATAWTGWLFFAVFLGIVIIWIFTVSERRIPEQGAFLTKIF